jgi:hypothetical protein
MNDAIPSAKIDGDNPFTAEIELFPQAGGWFYVRVPAELCESYHDWQHMGLIAVHITASANGRSLSWDSSLMPMGDGSHFIPLPKRIRSKLGLGLGDRVDLDFSLRER